MLSTKNSPDPSCSSKLPVLRGGESTAEKISSQGGDPILEDTPTPSFCIRDYVFASRSKGIDTSWPFTRHILQLCSKHGIKNPLPPFEAPGLVRIQCQSKGVEPVQPLAFSDVECTSAHVDPQSEAVNIRHHSYLLAEKSSPDEKSVTCQRVSKAKLVHSSAEIGLRITTHDQVERSSTENDGISCSLAKHRGLPKAPSELFIAEPAKKLSSSCETSDTHCRPTATLGVICGNSRAEDKTSYSSIVSDPMASSKVCPVCKTFSSTSNTTLNAHIDQCLSTESHTKGVPTEFLALKVKPRKKRSMVDIYATAPRCTLEDLDKRNGSNWANELAFVAAPVVSETAPEAKKPRLAAFNSKGDANEGAVYVDSNGVKLGIVSKLNGVPLLKKDERRLQKCTEVVGTSKRLLINKNHLSAKYLKKMRAKAQKTNLCSFMLFKTQEGDYNAVSHHENGESLSHVSAENLLKSCRSASLRKWICSRRSDVPKKLVSKNVHGASSKYELLTRSRLAERNRSEVGTSIAIRHQLEISRSAEEPTCLTKVNKIEFLPKTAHSMDVMKNSIKSSISVSASRWSPENTSERSLLSRASKPSATFVTSSQRKTKEFELDIPHKSDSSCDSTNVSSDVCNFSVKNRINTTFNDAGQSFSLVARKCDLYVEPSAAATFRKRRSIPRSSKRAEFPSATNGVHGVDIGKSSKSLISCEFDNSKIVNPPNEGDAMKNASPLSREAPGCEATDDRSTIEEQKLFNTLDAEHSHIQVEVLDSENNIGNPTVEMADSNPLSNDCLHSEILQTDIASRFKPSPMIEHSQFKSESEVHEEQLTKISEKQEACSDESREVNEENIQVAAKSKESMEKNSGVAQPTECNVDAMSVQESSGYLTSHGYAQYGLAKRSSSGNSHRVAVDSAINLVGDSELCGSPVLATSTISFASPKDLKFTESDAEPSATAIDAEDKLEAAVPISEDRTEADEMNTGVRNDEIKVKLPSKVPDRSAGDKAFSCSCRESLSREIRLSRPNNACSTTKGRQTSNLFPGSRVSSSFSSYKNQRTNTAISTNLQPTAQSTSMKGLLDSAVKVQTFSALGSATDQSQTQAIQNPVLRLMGKNLMVVTNQEFVQSSGVTLDYQLQRNLSSSHGFASNSYNLQIMGASPAVGPTVSRGEHRFPPCFPSTPMAGFSATQLHTAIMPRPDQHTQQNNAFRRTSPSPAPYMKNEVILMDDFPDTDDAPINFHTPASNPYSQRSNSSSFPPQCRIAHLPAGGARTLSPNPYISIGNNLMEMRSTPEGLGPPRSIPLMFHQPPATPRMRSSVCYSQQR